MADTYNSINTVTGTITPDELGRTLAHEHLLIGWPGWESDTFRTGPTKDECMARCRERVAEMFGQPFDLKGMLAEFPETAYAF